MNSTILKLFSEAFEGENNYLLMMKQPGYFNFFLSMVKCMRNFITLKLFDISNPDCEEDD